VRRRVATTALHGPGATQTSDSIRQQTIQPGPSQATLLVHLVTLTAASSSPPSTGWFGVGPRHPRRALPAVCLTFDLRSVAATPTLAQQPRTGHRMRGPPGMRRAARPPATRGTSAMSTGGMRGPPVHHRCSLTRQPRCVEFVGAPIDQRRRRWTGTASSAHRPVSHGLRRVIRQPSVRPQLARISNAASRSACRGPSLTEMSNVPS